MDLESLDKEALLELVRKQAEKIQDLEQSEKEVENQESKLTEQEVKIDFKFVTLKLSMRPTWFVYWSQKTLPNMHWLSG